MTLGQCLLLAENVTGDTKAESNTFGGVELACAA